MKLPASGLHYLALGHSHSASGLKRAGKTYYAWPGCPEGRGFDETGDKGVYLGQLEGGRVSLDFVPLARRRYLTPSLDITGQDPAQALEALIRASRPEDILRISLTGTRDPDNEPNLTALTALASGYFYSASLYDNTTLSQALWARMEEDTLTGSSSGPWPAASQEAAPSERPLLERRSGSAWPPWKEGRDPNETLAAHRHLRLLTGGHPGIRPGDDPHRGPQRQREIHLCAFLRTMLYGLDTRQRDRKGAPPTKTVTGPGAAPPWRGCWSVNSRAGSWSSAGPPPAGCHGGFFRGLPGHRPGPCRPDRGDRRGDPHWREPGGL